MLNSTLRNLLSNAVKFTKQGGKVIIKVGETVNNMIEIAVIDSGIGMPEHLAEKLFNVAEKFGREASRGKGEYFLFYDSCSGQRFPGS